jgi:hypothetical protein
MLHQKEIHELIAEDTVIQFSHVGTSCCLLRRVGHSLISNRAREEFQITNRIDMAVA